MINGPQELHPFETFFPPDTTRLILGSIPPFRFTRGPGEKVKEDGDFPFYYGSRYNLFWKLLGEVFQEPLTDINAIQALLLKQKIGIADIVKQCTRKQKKGKPSAADADLRVKQWHTELREILETPSLRKILFTSRWVHDNFKRHIGAHPELEKAILISPSPAANMHIGSLAAYKQLKTENPAYTPNDFRLARYREAFQ